MMSGENNLMYIKITMNKMKIELLLHLPCYCEHEWQSNKWISWAHSFSLLSLISHLMLLFISSLLSTSFFSPVILSLHSHHSLNSLLPPHRCITDNDVSQSSVPLSVARTISNNITAKTSETTPTTTTTTAATVASTANATAMANSTVTPSVIPDPFIPAPRSGTSGTGIPSPRVVLPSQDTPSYYSSASASASSSSSSSISFPVHKRVSDRRVQSRRFDQQCRLTSEVRKK